MTGLIVPDKNTATYIHDVNINLLLAIQPIMAEFLECAFGADFLPGSKGNRTG